MYIFLEPGVRRLAFMLHRGPLGHVQYVRDQELKLEKRRAKDAELEALEFDAWDY